MVHCIMHGKKIERKKSGEKLFGSNENVVEWVTSLGQHLNGSKIVIQAYYNIYSLVSESNRCLRKNNSEQANIGASQEKTHTLQLNRLGAPSILFLATILTQDVFMYLLIIISVFPGGP